MHAADHARRFSAECPASFQAGHRRTQRLNLKAVHGASVRGPPGSSTSRTATRRNRRPALEGREQPPGSPRANDCSGLPAAAGTGWKAAGGYHQHVPRGWLDERRRSSCVGPRLGWIGTNIGDRLPGAIGTVRISAAAANDAIGCGRRGGGRPDAGGASVDAEVIAHVQRTCDVPAKIGEWIGRPGSCGSRGLVCRLTPADIEDQAVPGRVWMSPWIEGASLWQLRDGATAAWALAEVFDDATVGDLAHDIPVALMLVLVRLSPLERASFSAARRARP